MCVPVAIILLPPFLPALATRLLAWGSPGPGLYRTQKFASEHLSFVREFSSAQDVKGVSHPILNKSVDIIAGPKEDGPATDILQQPYSITTDSSHRIFVTDLTGGTVHVFDFVQSKYSLLRGGDPPRSPMGIGADREGNIYVSDSVLGTVLVYDSRGRFSHYLKQSSARESYFETPRGIAVDAATEHIYVCDNTRHMVIKLDKNGQVLARFGIRGGGNGPGEFRRPTQVVVGGDEIFVFDSGNFRIQILDMQGHFRKEIRLAAAGNRAGLAVDNERNVYVSDPLLNHIQVFNHDGKLLYEFGEQGKEPGQFNGISGIWVDSGHCLYTADTHNKRVQLFRINGRDANGC